ncbi:hypothetical protein BKA70DRAFT_504307 [Coprinopsis sp. MPI-PUGE-AT-0042]|nr:hypothetical protein BKA70DRAFT_504307 [Coprinopsis sp. MPI-PUGE-AT-0042]
MHRCLSIPEILLNVFDEFDTLAPDALGDSEWKPSQAAPLGALAATCKTFHIPAVKALWRNLPGLSVISYLMDESIFVVEDGVVHLVAALDNGFAKRLEFYATFVKYINHYSEFETRRLHPSVLLALNVSSLIPTPIFRNLERVNLPYFADEEKETMFYPAIVLGSSSLVEVNVYSDVQMHWLEATGQWAATSDQGQWEALANRLLPFAGRLQMLGLHSNSYDRSTRLLSTPNITRLLNALSDSITDLDVSPFQLPRTTVAAFQSLSNLANLHISVDDETFGASNTSPASRLFMPSLLNLRLTAMSIPSGISFLSSICAKRLGELTLNVNLGSSIRGEVDPARLIGALGQWTSTVALSKLTIQRHDQYGPSTNGNFQFKITDTALSPLGAFSNMTHVRILPCIHSLSDDGLVATLSSWKHLEEFSLSSKRTQVLVRDGLKLSLDGVHKAIKQCPRLSRLTLECDFREVAPSADLSSHQKLSYWDVGCSPITSGRLFTEWASVHLPALREVEYFAYLRWKITVSFDMGWNSAKPSMPYLDQWNDVPKLLNAKK